MKNDAVVEAWIAAVPQADALRARTEAQLRERLAARGIGVQAVTSRTKSVESLRRKVARPDKTYAQLWDVTDLVGLRIVTSLEDAIPDVARMIEEHYTVDFAHSTDKLRQRDPAAFGYRSLHYVCAAPAELGLDPAFRFEVQVRSALQHAWAEVEHGLGYKASHAVPEQIRRRFSRIASLLEIADSEFVSIKGDLSRYQARVRADLADQEHPPALDTVSLAALVDDPRVRALDSQLAAALRKPLVDDVFFPDYLVTLLRAAGLHTTRDVLAAVEVHSGAALALVEAYFGFTRDTWQLDSGSIDAVQRGYALFFVAHAAVLSADELGISRVAKLAQVYQELDYPGDARTAQRIASGLAAALLPALRSALAALVATIVMWGASGCPAPSRGPIDPDPAVPPRGVIAVIAGETSTGIADGVGAAARFNGPAGVGATANTAWVADTFSSSLRQVDLTTQQVTTRLRAPNAGEPRGITGVLDTVFFADGPCIRRLDADDTLTTLAGTCTTTGYADGPAAEARFSFLLHDLEVLTDASGAPLRIFAADRLNDAVRVLDLATDTVSTLAGGGGPGNVDGVGQQARFDGPGGLALDRAATPPVLYVADTFNGQIRAVDTADGTVTTVCPAPEPQGVALVAGVLAFGGFTGRLDGWELAGGAPLTIVAGLGGTFASPAEIPGTTALLYFNLDGPLVRIDTSAGIEVSDRVTHVAGPRDPVGYRDGPGPDARFNLPTAVEIDPAAGVAWVADGGNSAIRTVDLADGRVRTLVGGPDRRGDEDGPFSSARLGFLAGMAHDADTARLYVADAGGQKIKVIDLEQQEVRTLAGSGVFGSGDGPAEIASFADPWGVALLDGALFVADASGPTVRRVALTDGAVTTVAGGPGQAGTADGTGDVARFRLPTGLAAAGGALWLCDAEAHTLRRIEPDGSAVTTVVGTPDFQGMAEGPGAFALLSTPLAVVAGDGGDTLYVAEAGNAVVRSVDLADADHASRVVLGQPGVPGGLPTGQATPIATATLLSPQDVAVFGADLVIVDDGAVLLGRP